MGGEGGDGTEGVLEDQVDVVVGEAGDGVAGEHDLVAAVDGVEGQVLDGDVHRDADADDRGDLEVAQQEVELGALEG